MTLRETQPCWARTHGQECAEPRKPGGGGGAWDLSSSQHVFQIGLGNSCIGISGKRRTGIKNPDPRATLPSLLNQDLQGWGLGVCILTSYYRVCAHQS